MSFSKIYLISVSNVGLTLSHKKVVQFIFKMPLLPFHRFLLFKNFQKKTFALNSHITWAAFLLGSISYSLVKNHFIIYLDRIEIVYLLILLSFFSLNMNDPFNSISTLSFIVTLSLTGLSLTTLTNTLQPIRILSWRKPHLVT